jgi:spore coat protein U-like protein
MKIKSFLFLLKIIILYENCFLKACAAQQTETTNFTVRAVVLKACPIGSTTLNFGNYSSNAALPGTSTIHVNCTSTTPYTVALNVGLGAQATFAGADGRKMTSGINRLGYNLYTANDHGIVWGDQTGGTQIVNGTGSGNNQDIIVYGQIPAGQNVPPANDYQDTITATITF